MSKNIAPRSRDFLFCGEVSQKSVATLTGQLLKVINYDIRTKAQDRKYDPEPIRIYIDSYGGDPNTCLGLTSVIEASPTPIHTVVTGSAMSAGFIIAVSGHIRFCYPNSSFMFHQLSYDFEGDLQSAKQEILENEKVQERMSRMVTRRTKITKSVIKEVIQGRLDWYLTANQAKKQGVVDRVVTKQIHLFDHLKQK